MVAQADSELTMGCTRTDCVRPILVICNITLPQLATFRCTWTKWQEGLGQVGSSR
jgi:hypothetical protein